MVRNEFPYITFITRLNFTFFIPQTSKYLYKHFYLIDKQEDKLKQKKSEPQPVYLRFLIGKPIGEKIPRNAPIMSYGEQALEPQYWFIIPSLEKADSLYFFFDQSCPKEKYGR